MVRTPIGDDGRSGSRVERVGLAGHASLVLKHTSAAYDRVARVTGGAGREANLFLSGVLDGLPPGVGHAIVDAYRRGDEWTIVMRDVSAGLIPNDHRATTAEVDRVLTAASRMHQAYARGPVPRFLCPLPAALANLSPAPMASIADSDDFAPLVLRGWERFAEIVPDDVATAVRGIHREPGALAARLQEFPSTLLHGDLWLVNCSLLPGEVVLLDWALATWGPPALDVAVFLAGHGSRMAPAREEVLERSAALAGPLHHPTATRLALAAGLALMGWNKALDATEHSDPAKRAVEAADLAWWVRRFDPS